MAGVVILALVLLAVAATVVPRWRRGDARARRELRLDLGWALLGAFVTRHVTKAIAIVAVVAVLLATGGSGDPAARIATLAERSPVSAWPLWVQIAVMLLASDFVGYWLHRWFHRGWAWRVHAIHHAPTDLTWLSAMRVHPINDLVPALVRGVPLVLLGFPIAHVAAVAPVFALWALLLHANLPWRLGWLRFVIATPPFHRWHHAADAEGRDCNFAGLFPIWDLLFGTFRLPAHGPARTGIDAPLPTGLFAQLASPFRRAASIR
jgi:sterol desaturase/sphingolipid hydroxylase (fatty acid hydroxylase superfamily)